MHYWWRSGSHTYTQRWRRLHPQPHLCLCVSQQSLPEPGSSLRKEQGENTKPSAQSKQLVSNNARTPLRYNYHLSKLEWDYPVRCLPPKLIHRSELVHMFDRGFLSHSHKSQCARHKRCQGQKFNSSEGLSVKRLTMDKVFADVFLAGCCDFMAM